jgi:hypothetical protein
MVSMTLSKEFVIELLPSNGPESYGTSIRSDSIGGNADHGLGPIEWFVEYLPEGQPVVLQLCLLVPGNCK